MIDKKLVEIGSAGTIDGVKYEMMDSKGIQQCKQCDLFQDEEACFRSDRVFGSCHGALRDDGKFVFFKKVQGY
jgi:hypothetical protein